MSRRGPPSVSGGAGRAGGRKPSSGPATPPPGAASGRAWGGEGGPAGAGGPGVQSAGHIEGAVYVFVRRGTSWVQEAELQASGASPGAGFGYAVAFDGSTVLVAAPWKAPAGAAYVFVRSGA